MQDKKLWTLKESLRDMIQDLVTLQDCQKIMNSHCGASCIGDEIYSKLKDLNKEELNGIAGVMQQMRRNNASYVEHSDVEIEKYFNLDLLFTVQEYLDQYED